MYLKHVHGKLFQSETNLHLSSPTDLKGDTGMRLSVFSIHLSISFLLCSCISRQTGQELISSLLHSSWYSPDQIDFWSHFAEFSPFPGLRFVELRPHSCRQSTNRIELKFSGWTHYGTLNFGHDPLNSCQFLASDLTSSFGTVTDKLLIRLSSSLVGEFIMGSLGRDWLYGHAAPISGLWSFEQFLSICRQTVDRIEP